MYVTIEAEKNTFNYLQSNTEAEQRSRHRKTPDPEQILESQGSVSKSTKDSRSVPKKPTTLDAKKDVRQQTMPAAITHAASDKLYREEARRASQEHLKNERQRSERKEKPNEIKRTSIPDKLIPLSPSHNTKTKTSFI
jgi:septal ring factor EnvC (AmiA/AmiB activator)